MAEIKEIKKDNDKRSELKTPSVDTPRKRDAEEESLVTDKVKSLLSQYNTKIRTSKTIEITGTGRLKLSNLSSTPATCQVGEFVLINGVVNVCTATDTFTVVGTQT